MESLRRKTAHTLLYEIRDGTVGGLPHTLITGAGQTGTPFHQSELGSQSGGQDHGVSQRTLTEKEAEKEREGRKGKDKTITNRK